MSVGQQDKGKANNKTNTKTKKYMATISHNKRKTGK